MIDFGVPLDFRNPARWARPFEDLYRDCIEEAVLAEELGYDHVWTTEHHFSEDSWSPSVLPILAAVAARTKQIRLGTYIVIAPLNNPIRVAEDVATVDIISRGRLDLGVGPGIDPKEFGTFGVPRKQRKARMYECLEIIRRCFTEERFSFKGKYYEFPDVRMTLKPIQKPYPPLWVAAVGEKSLKDAANGGYHLAGSGPVHHQRAYDEALRQAGRNPENHHIAQLRQLYLSDNRERAWDDIEEHLHYALGWHRQLFIDAADATLQKDSQIPPLPPARELRNMQQLGFFVPAIIGTPDDAIKMIEAYRAETRVTHLVLGTQLPGLDPRKARRSMELFAKYVIPHFRA
jgi:alkanesulfonate monooxygenase SsuD/methylene tetrahydromethanopterin reductase-like flavin-dependent oxidoreductase (luciferase family)